MSKDATLWNAQNTTNVYLSTSKLDGITPEQVSNWVNLQLVFDYPYLNWLVISYKAADAKGQNQGAWKCSQCFSFFNVQGYTIIVTGFAKDSTPNNALISSTDFDTQIPTFQSAKDLADTFYNNYCLMGVVATMNGVETGFSHPPAYTGARIIKGSNKYKGQAVIWAINEACPHSDLLA